MEAELILTSVRADNGKASVIAGGRFAAVFGSSFKPSKSRMPSFFVWKRTAYEKCRHANYKYRYACSESHIMLSLNINQLAVVISRYKHSGIQHMDKAAAFPAALILLFEYTSILKR